MRLDVDEELDGVAGPRRRCRLKQDSQDVVDEDVDEEVDEWQQVRRPRRLESSGPNGRRGSGARTR